MPHAARKVLFLAVCAAIPRLASAQASPPGITAARAEGIQDFATLLGNFLDVLELNLERRRELADHESTLARLERLTGVTLP